MEFGPAFPRRLGTVALGLAIGRMGGRVVGVGAPDKYKYYYFTTRPSDFKKHPRKHFADVAIKFKKRKKKPL